MAWRKLLWNRKVLTWMLTLNLIVLGAIMLFLYDSRSFGNKSLSYQRAYDRWRAIRENFDSYSKVRARENMFKIKGLQMDRVQGFDFAENAHEKDREKSNGGQDARDNNQRVFYGAGPLSFIPPVPEYSDSDVVPYLFPNITEQFLKLPATKHTYKIVILTPVCDVATLLERFAEQLANLSYPHHLISVYFGEDSSSDRTLDMATLIAADLKNKFGFKASEAFHLNISGGIHGSWADVHHRTSQHTRRSHLAKARNLLLKVALERDLFDYVLWIDSDVSELPRDLIQQLLFAKSDVVAPSCLFKTDGFKRVFDKNTWRETPTSLADQENLPKDILLVEGYSFTYRLYLSDLRAEGRVVPLDGVGGCSLLVRAACHRNGLIFPEEVYKHHIETEGLAKLARGMGYKVVGMPFVEVFH